MDISGTISRSQFKQACQLLICKQKAYSGNELTARSRVGWHWHEHSGMSALGYMTRVGSAFRTAPGILSLPGPEADFAEDVDEDDDSTLPHESPSRAHLAVQQHIVYSPTFQVPAYYFTIQDSNGSPLPLDQIIRTTLFHAQVLPECIDVAPHGISMPASNFPLLSQGDHPVLGTPCWYIHPCETSAAVTELLKETGPGKDQTTDERLLHWMETWFLVLCSVVDLR